MMTTDELKNVLMLHRKWLHGEHGEHGGKRATLIGATLSGANLRSANLSGATLIGATLSGATLSGANLRSATLSGANLSGANLRSANLSGATLSGANLSGANLSGANLSSATLSGANLSGATLRSANLIGADLSGANLSGANLSGTTLRGANWTHDGRKLPIEAVPDMRARVLAAVERDGCSINMDQWHTCETTHCLAGWIVTLHPQGRLLESLLSPSTAAAIILDACGEAIPDFYDTGDGADDRAMKWLRTGVQADPSSPEVSSWSNSAKQVYHGKPIIGPPYPSHSHEPEPKGSVWAVLAMAVIGFAAAFGLLFAAVKVIRFAWGE